MSYDLAFFRPAAGQDPLQCYQQIMDLEEAEVSDQSGTQPLPPEVQADIRRWADLLKSAWPSFTEFTLPPPIFWIQLDDRIAEVQAVVSERTISVTVPYFEGGDRMLHCLQTCLQTLAPHGFVAFDPQLGRAVTAADLPLMRDTYLSVNNAVATPSAESPASTAPMGTKPWWRFW